MSDIRKRTRYVLVLTGLFFGHVVQANDPVKRYPDFNKTYTNAELEVYKNYYTARNDSLGLAYTYANWAKTMGPYYKVELTKFKQLFTYLPIIRRNSEKDYYKLLYVLVEHFYLSQERYSIDQSITLCDTIINYGKRVHNPQLEFDAYLSKIYFLRKLTSSPDLFTQYQRETNRLIRQPIYKKTLYYIITGGWLMEQGRYDEAVPYLRKSFDQSRSEHSFKDQSVSLLFLGKLFRLKKELAKALNTFQEVDKLLRQNPEIDLQRWMHEEYANVYQLLGNYRKASFHWSQYDKQVKRLNDLKSKLGDFSSLRMEFIENELKLENENYKLGQRLARAQNDRRKSQLIAIAICSILMAVLIFALTVYYKQRIKMLINLRKMALLQGQELERGEIARELHDHVGSLLAGIRVNIPTNASNHEQLIHWIDEAYQSVRTLSHSLHTGVLKEDGLPQACSDFINLVDTQRIVALHVHGKQQPLPPFTTIMAYRIIQELITNALRHANARDIQLTLLFAENSLLISVADDGVGFDPTASYTGLGLRSIKERVNTLGGQLEFDDSDKAGMTVLVTLPLTF